MTQLQLVKTSPTGIRFSFIGGNCSPSFSGFSRASVRRSMTDKHRSFAVIVAHLPSNSRTSSITFGASTVAMGWKMKVPFLISAPVVPLSFLRV